VYAKACGSYINEALLNAEMTVAIGNLCENIAKSDFQVFFKLLLPVGLPALPIYESAYKLH